MPYKANLQAAVRKLPGATVIDLRGEIDSTSETSLLRAYDQAARDDPPAIVLNLSGVDYINSSGMALLVRLLVEAKQAGRATIAYGVREHFAELFHVLRLTDYMAIYPDEASALAAVRTNSPPGQAGA
jgi:anti-anti-sigma factor